MRLFTAGWYVVTKGKILSLALFFCIKADGLAAKLTHERDPSMTILGYLLSSGVVRISQGSAQMFLKSLFASPLMKPFFTPGRWHELKCVY